MKKRYSVMPADDATVDSDEMKAVFRVAVDVKMPSDASNKKKKAVFHVSRS
jgi:hypothetical protein